MPEWVVKEVEETSQSKNHMTMLSDDILRLPPPPSMENIEENNDGREDSINT